MWKFFPCTQIIFKPLSGGYIRYAVLPSIRRSYAATPYRFFSSLYSFMRTFLVALLAAFVGSIEAKMDASFTSIVQEADHERDLLKATTKRFRAIAAKMPALFRE